MDNKLVFSYTIVNLLEGDSKTALVGALTVDLADANWSRFNRVTSDAVWSKANTVGCREQDTIGVLNPHQTIQSDMVVIDSAIDKVRRRDRDFWNGIHLSHDYSNV